MHESKAQRRAEWRTTTVMMLMTLYYSYSAALLIANAPYVSSFKLSRSSLSLSSSVVNGLSLSLSSPTVLDGKGEAISLANSLKNEHDYGERSVLSHGVYDIQNEAQHRSLIEANMEVTIPLK